MALRIQRSAGLYCDNFLLLQEDIRQERANTQRPVRPDDKRSECATVAWNAPSVSAVYRWPASALCLDLSVRSYLSAWNSDWAW